MEQKCPVGPVCRCSFHLSQTGFDEDEFEQVGCFVVEGCAQVLVFAGKEQAALE